MKQTNTNTATESSTNKSLYLTLGSLVAVTLLSGMTLASIKTYADNDSVTDQVEITVPTACTMTGTGQTSHTATLDPGTYSASSGTDYTNGIGKTTITTYCNDYNGFSIYAIGFTNNEEGNNTLKGTSVSGNATIATKAYEQGDTISNWSMKLTKVTDTTASFNPSNMTITQGYDNTYHAVPDDYTKVVEYKASTGSSATDQGTGALGAKLETTYAAFISTTQPADTYTGQVKYVMVHPYDGIAPHKPSISQLEYMQDFAALTSAERTAVLSSMQTNTSYSLKDNRDQTSYKIAKLADGNVWLQDNLVLDLTDSTILNSLSSNNTNIDPNNETAILTSLKSGNRSAGDQYATYGVTGSSSINHFSEPRVNLAYKNTIPSDATSTTGSYKVGGYYNLCAASAGSYCYGNGSTEAGISSGDVTSSICPKGWRLPTGGDNGEYKALYDIIETYSGYRSALRLPLSGVHFNDSAQYQGNSGNWWSSTRSGGSAMYSLNTNTNEINLGSEAYRASGVSIRCILNH